MPRAWKAGRVSTTKLIFGSGFYLFCGPLGVVLIVLNGLGDESAKILEALGPGLALGLVAGFALVRNTVPPKPENEA